MLARYRSLPRTVHILCLGTFINRAGTLMIPFLTLYLQDSLGLGIEVATRAIGFYGAGAMGAALAGGYLADRIGRRAVMLGALLGGAGMLLFFAHLRTPAAIYLGIALFALVAESYRPAAAAMIADLVRGEQQTRAFGLMYFSINLGFCIGPVIGGVVAERSFQWLFWGDALTSAVFGLILLFAVRETLPRQPATASPTPAPAPAGEAPWLSTVRAILRDRTFMIFVAASFLAAMVFMQIMSTFPLYLQRFGIGPGTYGALIAVNAGMVVILTLPITSWITRFPRGPLIALASVFTGLGFGAIGIATTTWKFVLAIVIFTIGELLSAPLTQAIVADLAPVELRGRYMGVLGLCFSAGLVVGPPLGGLVLARFGGGWAWGGCFALGLCSAGLYLSIWRRLSVPAA